MCPLTTPLGTCSRTQVTGSTSSTIPRPDRTRKHRHARGLAPVYTPLLAPLHSVRIAGPQNAKLIARAHHPEARSEHPLDRSLGVAIRILSLFFFAGLTNFLDQYRIDKPASEICGQIMISYFVTFLPISLSTSFNRSRATNCSMSGRGLPAGHPSSGVVLD